MRAAGALLVLALTACSSSAEQTDVSSTSVPLSSSTTATTTPRDPTTSTVVTSTPSSDTTTTIGLLPSDALVVEAFPVPPGSHPHDVAPASDGGIWYTAQASGELGWLDPETGETRHTSLGPGSRPHGVIVDDAGVAWITDGGLNAIVSVHPATLEVTVYPLPADRPDANLNTASLDGDGILWFTGQAGIYGSLDPTTGEMNVYDAPEGRGPYGITTTPGGEVFYASLAGSFVGAIGADGSTLVLEPPNSDQGARRVWADSVGAIWVSEWNSGSLSRYRPGTDEWSTWPLPGDDPHAYAVFVDDADIVWVSDFGSNSIVRFDPSLEDFTVVPLPHDPGEVRQIHGRRGEVWGAESAADQLVLIRTR